MFVCWHPRAERNLEWFEAVWRRCKAILHIAPEYGDVPRLGGGEQHPGDAIALPKLPSHFHSGRDLIPSRHWGVTLHIALRDHLSVISGERRSDDQTRFWT